MISEGKFYTEIRGWAIKPLGQWWIAGGLPRIFATRKEAREYRRKLGLNDAPLVHICIKMEDTK
jgi:hypothetical protein